MTASGFRIEMEPSVVVRNYSMEATQRGGGTFWGMITLRDAAWAVTYRLLARKVPAVLYRHRWLMWEVQVAQTVPGPHQANRELNDESKPHIARN